MPPSVESPSPARTIRLMHASFILGQLLFAGVTFFKVRPHLTDAAPLSALVSYFESASPLALTAAAIPVALLIALNPWRLERR